MCPSTVLCRLCLCFSSEFKALVDETGEYNEIYDIASTYFDEMLLSPEICMDCWQHIHVFYEYQQSVLKAQSNLNDVKIESEPTALEMVQINQDNEYNLKEEGGEENINGIIDYSSFDSDDDEVLSSDHFNKKIGAFGEQTTQETKCNIKKHDISNQKSSFKCSMCDKNFKNTRLLTAHTVTHTVRETFKCPHCPTKFQGNRSIRRHVRQFHPNEISNFDIRELKSLNSSSENTDIQNANDASKTHFKVLKNIEENSFGYILKEETIEPDNGATERNYKCSKCDREYSNACDFRYHLATHTKESIYQCPFCSTKLTLPRNIRRHIKLLHPEKYDEYVSNVSYSPTKFKEKNTSHVKRSHVRKPKNKNLILNLNVRKDGISYDKNAGIQSNEQTSETLFEQLNSFNDTSEVETLGPDLHNDDTTESERKYKCTKCSREYSKSLDLRDHMATHQNEAINQCPYCPTKLTLPRNLRRHIKTLHPEKYIEPNVDVPKVDLNLLGQHLINLDPTLAIIENRDNINEHLPNYNDYDAFIAKWKQDLECDLCKNKFKSFDILREHFKVEHPQDKCHVVCCEQKILFRIRLVDHIRLHLDPNSFKCTICGRCSDNGNLLKLHMRSHSDEKPFQCNVCQKRFRKKDKLLVHSGIHSTEKNHFCKICNKGFSTIFLLKKHGYIHKKDFYTKHLCDQCGKPCYSPNILKEHLLTHDGTETSTSKWPCDICGAKLKTRFTLRIHKIRCHHDNKTAYECSECGKISLNKFALKNHKKNAHGKEIGKRNVPKFQCTICLKVFTSALSYRLHGATHAKEGTRYQCPHCPMKMKQKKNLPRHIQIAHPTEFCETNRRRRSKVDLSLIEQKIVI